MTNEHIEKLKRLIAFRERQRDLATVEMEAALRREEAAERERVQAEQMLQKELQTFRETVGTSVRPLDLELAVQSAKWAQTELHGKEETVVKHKQMTSEQRSKLLESHKKVKQMEELHKQKKHERNRQLTLTQQSEMDDLAAIREAKQ